MAFRRPRIPVVALDTNVLVQSLPEKGRFRPIIEGFVVGRIRWVVSTEILNEYQEILNEKGGPRAGGALSALLEFYRDYVVRVAPTYHWQALEIDVDDNKFVDAAVAASADWIVTEDRGFDVLHRDERLTIRPISAQRFIDRYL